MLTVKVVRIGSKATPNEEWVFEAKDVTKELGGLLCQLESETIYVGCAGQQMDLDCEWRRGTSVTDEGQPVTKFNMADVFIMNRHGATVAKYVI